MKQTCLILLISASIFAQNKISDKVAVAAVLDNWHKAASEAKFDGYFSQMTSDAVFIGTDPGENWPLDTFKAFAKPIFEKGKAWDFKCVERHIYFSGDGSIAWFDELLDTWMKLCRGSGVLKKENGQWKIAHYVLSMAIPNDDTSQIVEIKSAYDDAILEKLRKK